PKSRYIGPWIPDQNFILQDPVPAEDYKQVYTQDIAQLEQDIINSGLTNQKLIKTAWDSAYTYRKTDYRGGSNGARIALA
ncbi:catalase-peroxidase, partial [Francisella tularensis subsp. holarctica]|nr:catalase-peroxidase [Francisella tularensis subsp. holarctica]